MISHEVTVKVLNVSDEQVAIANATLWLSETASGIETIQTVSAKEADDCHLITIRATLTQEAVEAIIDSNGMHITD